MACKPVRRYHYFASGKMTLAMAAAAIICLSAHADTAPGKDLAENENAKKRPHEKRVIEPMPRLPEREELVYNVKWLGIPVGTTKACIKGIRDMDGRKVYELEITARTNDFCSGIYKIEDRYVSYMDVEGLYPLRHEVYRREGRYKKDAIVTFDQKNHKAYFKNFLDRSEKVVNIPPKVQDPVSMAYYFRLVPVSLGDKKEFSVYNNESVYQIYGVIDEMLVRRVPIFGKKEVFHVQPYARLKGEVVKKGRARAYFSCDKKRIPLIGVVRGPVFTEVTACLSKID